MARAKDFEVFKEGKLVLGYLQAQDVKTKVSIVTIKDKLQILVEILAIRYDGDPGVEVLREVHHTTIKDFLIGIGATLRTDGSNVYIIEIPES